MEINKKFQNDFPSLGIGTMLWLPKSNAEKEELFRTYKYCIDRGFNFFDTAEVYGNGKVETLLGEFIKRDGRPVRISSKFAPPSSMNPMAPKRKNVAIDSPEAIWEALEESLMRLGIPSLELYLMHTPPNSHSITDYMDVMAQTVQQGKVKKIGVCNFSAAQIDESANALKKYGLSLSSVMVGYNILRRYPETNGVFDVCKKHNVTLIPYAPLAEGTLTGKYRGKKVPFKYFVTSYFGHLNMTRERDDDISFIKRLFSKPRECDIKRMEPILVEMEKIGNIHGKSIAQVAINWLYTTPEVQVFPIPGMRSVKQAVDNIGAVNWCMTTEERESICRAEMAVR